MKQKSPRSDEEKIRDFQNKLYLKAKQAKDFRFYVLYDKVRSKRFLREAYKRVKKNGGRSGVDGITFKDIESYGAEKYLDEIHDELANKKYKPQPVLRVHIPKANGKRRPLGIPTIKDRIVQMSCKMVIEPIFEADFEESSYGFRPKRSSKNAMKAIKDNLQEGRTHILDADLSSYFDTIPHKKLLILIGKRISDRNVIHLIKMWLKTPVIENGKISGGKKNQVGTPQGGVISPLLANVYLHLVDKMVRVNQIFKKAGIKMVRYADDFVLMGKEITEAAREKLKWILARMELTLNEEKTKLVDGTEKPFDFLGFTVRYDKDLYGRNRKYWNIIPSKKACKKLRENIRDCLKGNGHANPAKISKELNWKLRGWINYFNIPGVSYPKKAFRDTRYYLMNRLNRYYYRKSQRKSRLYRRKAFDVLVNQYGLIDPSKC